MERRVLIVFDDIIPAMISNRYKIKYTFNAIQKIILYCNKRCKNKWHTLFYHEGVRWKRASLNCC